MLKLRASKSLYSVQVNREVFRYMSVAGNISRLNISGLNINIHQSIVPDNWSI